jgi:uncharacterized protein YfiM (DUF2279 family)
VSYLRTVIAAVLAGAGLFAADKIVAFGGAGPVKYLLLFGPAVLFAAGIEVLMSDYARGPYSWRALASDVAGAVIAAIVIFFTAMRVGEPVFSNPQPWILMAFLTMLLSVGIGYVRSLRAPAGNSSEGAADR